MIARKYVLEKLQQKMSLDPNFQAFGVERHRYKLRPPIPEEKLTQLEQDNEITLPPDYRSFITTIGDGGAGPGYGLYAVETQLDTTFTDPTYPDHVDVDRRRSSTWDQSTWTGKGPVDVDRQRSST